MRNVFDEAARRVLAISAQRVETHLVEDQDEKKKEKRQRGMLKGPLDAVVGRNERICTMARQ